MVLRKATRGLPKGFQTLTERPFTFDLTCSEHELK